VKSGPGTLGGAVARHELLVRDPARRHDLGLRQRKHDVTPAEHEGAGPEEAVEHLQGLRGHQARQDRQSDEQGEEDRQDADRQPVADGDVHARRGRRPVDPEQPPAREAGQHDYQDLDGGGRHREDRPGRGDRHGGPGTVRQEGAAHAPDRLGHDRHRHDLQPVQPPRAGDVDRLQAVRERHQRHGRRPREADPRGQAADQPGPEDHERDAHLARRGPGQELAERVHSRSRRATIALFGGRSNSKNRRTENIQVTERGYGCGRARRPDIHSVVLTARPP
jgi:hypothetical protein